jgi:hypothetical protein
MQRLEVSGAVQGSLGFKGLNRHEFNIICTVHEAHEANTLHGGRNPPVLFPKVLDNPNYGRM